MAEQEDETLTTGEIAELAEEVVPKMVQRKTVYVVEEEFTHKRKHTVGSLFRPRRFPRLRPTRLRELIAEGKIRPATAEEQRAQANKVEIRKNREQAVSDAPVAVEASAPVSSEPEVRHVGGGWYEVTFEGETQKVQGEAAALELAASLTEDSDG